MLKKMLSLLVITTFFSGFTVKAASADEPFQPEKFPYKEMQIQVMPEFDYPENWPADEPSLLVGQYGTIENKTGKDFAGAIEIPVPVNDKNFQIYLVAEFPSDKKPEVQRPFEVNKEKGIVSWKPEKPIKNGESYKYVVEYYSNPIEVSDKKAFTYEYKNQSDMEKLDIIIYAPLNSKDITLEPKSMKNEKSDYGEEIHYYQYTNLRKDNTSKITVRYKKADNKSTISSIDKKQAPNDANHSGTKDGSTATDQVLKNSDGNESGSRPIIDTTGAIIIGLSVVIASIFIFLGLKGNKRPPGKASKSKTVQKPAKKATLKKAGKDSVSDEKKELRKKLLKGTIDQETYEVQIKKLI
jgi:hypothetical protein